MPASTATPHSTTIGPTPTVLPGVATAVATNTRLAYIHEGTNITKVQETHYYPFGMRISTISNQPVNLGTERNNAFLYNGKEVNDDFGLNWYDYGARFYDAQIGRWHSIDPHAENYLPISPYAYVGNNPLIYIDPDGRDRRLIYNHSNKIITVRATYYHSIGATKSARAGVRVFNNMEGVTYTDKEGKTWNVKFDLTTQRSGNPPGKALGDNQGNSFDLEKTVINPD